MKESASIASLPVGICYHQGGAAEQAGKGCAVQVQLLSVVIVHSVHHIFTQSCADAPNASADHVPSSKRSDDQTFTLACSILNTNSVSAASSIVWHSMARHGTAYNSTAWHGMARHGIVAWHGLS